MFCTYMAGYWCSDFYSDSWEDQQQSGVCQAQSALAPGVSERKTLRSNSQLTQQIILSEMIPCGRYQTENILTDH